MTRWRTLHLAWISFAITFYAWFSLAPVAPLVQRDLGLSNGQIAWLTAAGVALTIPGRLVVGAMVDRLGPRRTFAALLLLLAIPVGLVGLASGFRELLVLRLLVGLVGCGFVIGIRLVADWFPHRELGLAEGIYGGWGNAGAGVAALVVPLLASRFGWRWAVASAVVPMVVWALVVARYVKDVPDGRVFRRPPVDSTYSPLRDPRGRVLALAYLASFGSELAVVGFLTKMLVDRFALTPLHAGLLASMFGLANGYSRPAGGWLADRFGASRTLFVSLSIGAGGYVLLGTAGTLAQAIVAIVVASTTVQAACGAVYAAVPLVRHDATGRIAGVVGAAGNVGAVLFPISFGLGLSVFHSYLPGFLACGAVCAVAAVAARSLRLVPESDGRSGDRDAAPAWPKRVAMVPARGATPSLSRRTP